MNEDIRLPITFFQDLAIMNLHSIHGAEAVLGWQKILIFTALHRPEDGVLRKVSDGALLRISGMTNNKFIQTLIDEELINQRDDGWYEINDWATSQPWASAVGKRAEFGRKAAEARWAGEKKH